MLSMYTQDESAPCLKRNVIWIKQYFAAKHTASPHFYANSEASSDLIHEWETSWNARDRRPLQWIKSMLQLNRHSRPTAARILELITSTDDFDHTPTTYCGICCVLDDETDSCDSLADEDTILAQPCAQNLVSSQSPQWDYESTEAAPLTGVTKGIDEQTRIDLYLFPVIKKERPVEIPPDAQNRSQSGMNNVTSEEEGKKDREKKREAFELALQQVPKVPDTHHIPVDTNREQSRDPQERPTDIDAASMSSTHSKPITSRDDESRHNASEPKIMNRTRRSFFVSNVPSRDERRSINWSFDGRDEDSGSNVANSGLDFNLVNRAHTPSSISDAPSSKEVQSSKHKSDWEPRQTFRGKTYYANHKTKESTWYEPDHEAPESSQRTAPVMQSLPHVGPKGEQSPSSPPSSSTNVKLTKRKKESRFFKLIERTSKPKAFGSSFVTNSNDSVISKHSIDSKYSTILKAPRTFTSILRDVTGPKDLTRPGDKTLHVALYDRNGEVLISIHVPVVIVKCCDFLIEKGPAIPSCLTAQKYDSDHLNKLDHVFEAPPSYGKDLDWADYSVFDAAEKLRRYLVACTSDAKHPFPQDIEDRLVKVRQANIGGSGHSNVVYKRGRILLGYTAQSDDEVTVERGDEVLILDNITSDLYCKVRRLKDGEEVMMPSDYIEVLNSATATSKNMALFLTTFKTILRELPTPQRQLLIYVLGFFKAFAEKSNSYSATMNDIMVRYHPVFFGYAETGRSKYWQQKEIIEFMIWNYYHLLRGEVEEQGSGGSPEGHTLKPDTKEKIHRKPVSTSTTGTSEPPSPHFDLVVPASIHKALPQPPNSVSADHIDTLQAQLDDLQTPVRREIVNRLLQDLNNPELSTPITTDLNRMRLIDRSKKEFADELAEIQIEEHDVGLRLQRARIKRERG